MSLITEDGSGLADAESYASVNDADTYLGNRLLTLWATMSTAEKEASLRRGTDYITQMYRPRWAGLRMTSTQALDWPRYDVPRADSPLGYYLTTVVPTEVKAACCEMAFKAAFGELNGELGQAKTSVQVGPMKTDYAQGSTAAKRYPAIDQLLRPMLAAGGGGAITMVRC